MAKRILTLLVLSLALFMIPSWAQTGPCITTGDGEPNCFTFDQGHPTHTYDFGSDGQLIVQFDVVLTSFDLRVRIHSPKPTDSTIICEGGPCATLIPLDPTEFPSGTRCVDYGTSTPGQCDQYDFTGNAGGPHGVPVRNKDYKGLITLTLTYDTSSTFVVHKPAFGHEPGDNTTFTEDILTFYFQTPPPLITLATVAQSSASDPAMGGKTPGLSSVVALDEPTSENDTFCFVSPTPGQIFTASQIKEIEVVFQLFSGGTGTCPMTGAPLRDKTASFSLAKTDSSGNFIASQPLLDKEEGNKFHWYDPTGLNEFDLSIVGLATGQWYTITVTSSKFSPPQSISFYLAP